jgi:hypothetical protein
VETADASGGGEQEAELPEGVVPAAVAAGRARLAALVVARCAEWEALPTTKKIHRMRRARDSRYE